MTTDSNLVNYKVGFGRDKHSRASLYHAEIRMNGNDCRSENQWYKGAPAFVVVLIICGVWLTNDIRMDPYRQIMNSKLK